MSSNPTKKYQLNEAQAKEMVAKLREDKPERSVSIMGVRGYNTKFYSSDKKATFGMVRATTGAQLAPIGDNGDKLIMKELGSVLLNWKGKGGRKETVTVEIFEELCKLVYFYDDWDRFKELLQIVMNEGRFQKIEGDLANLKFSTDARFKDVQLQLDDLKKDADKKAPLTTTPVKNTPPKTSSWRFVFTVIIIIVLSACVILYNVETNDIASGTTGAVTTVTATFTAVTTGIQAWLDNDIMKTVQDDVTTTFTAVTTGIQAWWLDNDIMKTVQDDVTTLMHTVQEKIYNFFVLVIWHTIQHQMGLALEWLGPAIAALANGRG